MGRVRKLIPRFSLRTLVVFMLLVTSGVGLWWHWEPWYLHFEFHGSRRFPGMGRFSKDGTSFYLIYKPKGKEDKWQNFVRSVWNAHSCKLLSTDGEPTGPEEANPFSAVRILELADGRRSVAYGSRTMAAEAKLEIRDVSRQSALATLRPASSGPLALDVSSDGEQMLLTAMEGSLFLYRRRRPEWWWGVFWLKEFWLTAAFAGLFVWSVVRDRRALREQVA